MMGNKALYLLLFYSEVKHLCLTHYMTVLNPRATLAKDIYIYK